MVWIIENTFNPNKDYNTSPVWSLLIYHRPYPKALYLPWNFISFVSAKEAKEAQEAQGAQDRQTKFVAIVNAFKKELEPIIRSALNETDTIIIPEFDDDIAGIPTKDKREKTKNLRIDNNSQTQDQDSAYAMMATLLYINAFEKYKGTSDLYDPVVKLYQLLRTVLRYALNEDHTNHYQRLKEWFKTDQKKPLPFDYENLIKEKIQQIQAESKLVINQKAEEKAKKKASSQSQSQRKIPKKAKTEEKSKKKSSPSDTKGTKRKVEEMTSAKAKEKVKDKDKDIVMKPVKESKDVGKKSQSKNEREDVAMTPISVSTQDKDKDVQMKSKSDEEREKEFQEAADAALF